jgi:hypothetical protein
LTSRPPGPSTQRPSGLVLLRALADNIGLTGGLSKALAPRRLLVHDRGRVLADLAYVIADGAELISDFRVMADQSELFGRVASVPTCWRALSEIAGGGGRALARITVSANAARRRAWAAAAARHGAIPGHPDRRQDPGAGDLHPAGCDRHPRALGARELAEPNFKGPTGRVRTASKARRKQGAAGNATLCHRQIRQAGLSGQARSRTQITRSGVAQEAMLAASSPLRSNPLCCCRCQVARRVLFAGGPGGVAGVSAAVARRLA